MLHQMIQNLQFKPSDGLIYQPKKLKQIKIYGFKSFDHITLAIQCSHF